MPKCEGCPIPGPCVGERPGHAYACRMARGSEAERLWVVEVSAGTPAAPPAAPAVEPKPTPLTYPSLARQAANLVGAAGRFVASGLKLVRQTEYDRRRTICVECPLYDAVRDRCARCGCSVAVKPWLKAEHCPVGKW